jgi:hypothetical protein
MADCPLHPVIAEDLRTIKMNQDKRPCQDHTARLNHLEKEDMKIHETNNEQWTAINRLRVMVYMGAGATGVLAFLGSILGTFLKR